MWNNAQLKYYAKSELHNSYWLSFTVSVIAAAIPNILSAVYNNSLLMMTGFSTVTYNYAYSDYSYYSHSGGPTIGSIIAMLLTAAAGIFVTNVLLVGSARFYTRCPYGDRNFSNLFVGFNSRSYTNIVLVMFMRGLYIFLWSLLFVIPGIIKTYQYCMVPYILSENPDINYKDALELSKAMTAGDKFNIFVLQISFIGWYFLGAMACGIGALFVQPYYEATMAQLYFALKAKINLGGGQASYQPPYNVQNPAAPTF